VVNVNEELKAAKTAINALSMTTPKSEVLATLRKANHVAVLNLSSGEPLNEARGNVGIALSNLIDQHGPPTPERIDKAKRAIDTWIQELGAANLKSHHGQVQ
jgi:hypothetical protein